MSNHIPLQRYDFRPGKSGYQPPMAPLQDAAAALFGYRPFLRSASSSEVSTGSCHGFSKPYFGGATVLQFLKFQN